MATQSKDLLVLLPTVWNLLFVGCHLLNLLFLLVSCRLTSTPHGYSVKGFVAFVACCLGFVVFRLLFVEFVAFVGFRPG